MSERETNPVRKLTTVVKFGGYIFLDFGPKIKEDGGVLIPVLVSIAVILILLVTFLIFMWKRKVHSFNQQKTKCR